MRRSLLFTLILLVSIVLVGCGGSDDTNVFTSSGSTIDQPFAGKLFLGAGIPNVPVAVEALDGATIATTTTNISGNYLFQQPLPTDFRVVARVNDELEFSREVRNFGTDRIFGTITVPTTLVSRLAQAEPGASIDQHEDKVREALRLREGTSLAKIDESVSEGFSHLAFFAFAARNGGVKAALETLAQGGIAERAFLLRADSLSGPFDALDPKLAEPLRRVADSRKVRLSTQRLLSRGVSQSHSGNFFGTNTQARAEIAQVRPQVIEVLAGAGLGVLTTVVNDVITSGLDVLYQSDTASTWSLSAVQARLSGVKTSLTNLSNQLTSLQQSVDQIISTINYDNMQQVIRTANTYQNDIKDQQDDYIQAITNALNTPNYFSGEPSTLPVNVASVITTLQAGATLDQLKTDVNQLQGLLTGASGVPATSLQIEYQPIVVDPGSSANPGAAQPNLVLIERDNILMNLGIPTTGFEHFGNVPFRNSLIIDSILGSFEAYGNSQILASNLIGESAHLSATPGQAIPEAVAYSENICRSLQSIRSQIPSYPVNDNYFIDLPNGLIWHTTLQAYVDDIPAFAQAYDDGDTTGWRTPTTQELTSLLRVAGSVNPQTDPFLYYGDVMEGLEALGFDLTALNGETIFQEPLYSLALDGIFYADNASYLFVDFNSNGQYSYTNLLDDEDLTDQEWFEEPRQYPFFMCRTIGTTPLYFEDNTWPPTASVTLTNEEIPTLGLFTAYTPPSISSLVLELAGNYEVFVGGTYSNVLFDGVLPLLTPSYTDVPFIPPTYFLTNDDAGNTVSTRPDSFGKITPHINADEPTTIEYNTLGWDGTTFPAEISGTTTFNLTAPAQVNLVSLMINPLNRAISVANMNANQQFLALGFFDDRTFQDLTGQVIWTVIDADTGQAPVGAEFSPDTPGLLELTDVPNPSTNLTITASVELTGNPSGSQSNSTSVKAEH